jgi:hypothetical protein
MQSSITVRLPFNYAANNQRGAVVWQDNLSWREGLFSDVTVGRLKGIKSTTEYGPILAVYKRLSAAGGNDWPNLSLRRIIMPASEPMGVLEKLFSSFYVVAVDTRLRTLSMVCSFTSRKSIAGSIDITVEYEVKDIRLVMRVADPLLALKKRVEQTVQDVAFDLGYPSLTSIDIRKSLLALEVEREIGIVLYNPLCGPVQWPGNIQALTSQPVIDGLVNQNQEEKNKYIVEKLAAMGITDPFLVTSVLSQSDKDFQIIVQHIQNYAQAQQNNAQSQLQLLQWLSEQNYITRADMQRLIIPLLDDMTSRSNPRGSVSSFLAGGQVTSDRQLPASTDDTSNQQTANQTTPRPTITRRRSVDNDDNPDTIPSDSQNTSHGAASQESHDDDSGPAIKQRRSVSFSDQDE